MSLDYSTSRNEPVRVLCVFGSLNRGGAETMCMNLYRHIDKSLIQFDFVTHSGPGGAYEEEIISLGGRVFYCPAYKVINDLSYRMWWYKHFCQHPEHKIIHGHYFSISAVYFSIAHRFGCITIGHSHCTSPNNERGIKAKLFQYYCDQVEHHSDYCLACSKDAGKWLFPSKSFRVLNNAIDVQKFRYEKTIAKEVRKELKLGDSFIIGTVGRFNLQKNPLGIVDIFYHIQLHRPDSRLIWVGDGPMRNETEEKAKSLGLEKKVLYLGVRSDVPRLLQAMDAFILPSYYEGLPVSLIEAQAAGIQCFCSNMITTEVAITNCCHFLSLDNKSEWAQRICNIKAFEEHPDMTVQIIQSGYEIKNTVQWLQDFYLSL